jgi:hypothetical protein
MEIILKHMGNWGEGRDRSRWTQVRVALLLGWGAALCQMLVAAVGSRAHYPSVGLDSWRLRRWTAYISLDDHGAR